MHHREISITVKNHYSDTKKRLFLSVCSQVLCLFSLHYSELTCAAVRNPIAQVIRRPNVISQYSLCISDPRKYSYLSFSLAQFNAAQDRLYGIHQDVQWAWVGEVFYPRLRHINVFLRSASPSCVIGLHAGYGYDYTKYHGYYINNGFAFSMIGCEALTPYWQCTINLYLNHKEKSSLLHDYHRKPYNTFRHLVGVNAKVSRKITQSIRLSTMFYYRQIEAEHHLLTVEKYINASQGTYTQVIKPKFGFIIEGNYRYNTYHKFRLSYTYDNWIIPQINCSWIMQATLKGWKPIQVAQKNMQDCFFSEIEPYYTDYRIPRENITDAGRSVLLAEREQAMDRFHEKEAKLVLATKSKILPGYAESNNIKQQIVDSVGRLWLTLNLAERYFLIDLTQNFAAKYNLPVELQSNIGIYLFEKYLSPLRDTSRTIMTILIEHIHAIAQEDQNKALYSYTATRRLTTDIKPYAWELKKFLHLPSDQDKKIVMSRYYARR